LITGKPIAKQSEMGAVKQAALCRFPRSGTENLEQRHSASYPNKRLASAGQFVSAVLAELFF
jgi:hypothetical protein